MRVENSVESSKELCQVAQATGDGGMARNATDSRNTSVLQPHQVGS